MRDPLHIIVILSDDQGEWAMGCSGNAEIRTPNLDRLAASGMRFTNFFCTSPVCSPARASLLTGRIPSQHGVHDWIRGGNIGSDAIEYLKELRGYTDVLHEGGYDCSISGKWHLGDSRRPQKSFSHWYVHQRGGGSYHGAPMVREGDFVSEAGYITEAITDDALSVLAKRAQETDRRPFYLSVHYTAPHSPWLNEHPLDIVASYDDCPFSSCPQEPPHSWELPSTVPASVRAEPREHLKGYFAAVTAMDRQIGRILDAVEAYGLRENTLICFLSDNGYNCGHHGIWGKGNGTFPLNMYDTSIRVPAIMSHPGRIPAGVVCDELLSGYDFSPTLLEYAGMEPSALGPRLPGASFARLLERGGGAGREHVVVYDEYGPVRMIRTKEWKYVHRYPYGPHELYDLVHDPEEKDNLWRESGDEDTVRAAQAQITLKAKMEEWFVEHADSRVDGVREPVSGRGQIRLAGPAAQGLPAFAQDR